MIAIKIYTFVVVLFSMRLIYFLVFLWLFVYKGHSQNKTYLGLIVAPTIDGCTVADGGSMILPIRLESWLWGLNVRQDIGKNISIESGLIRKYYARGFAFNTKLTYPIVGITSKAINAWLIPLRFVSKFNIYDEKIFFRTNIAYNFAINPNYKSLSYGSIDGSIGEISELNYQTNYGYRKYFSLLETGGGAEFKIRKSILLSLDMNYLLGFKKIYQTDIEYTLSSGNSFNAFVTSKGEYLCVSAKLLYLIK